MRIDAHQHFWKYDSARHFWMDDAMAVIRRDFLPSHLEKIYGENGIDGCVAVQVDQTPDENNFLLALARESDIIKGVVGWIDLRDSAIDFKLEEYQNEAYMKGWRHIVQGEADHNFLLRPDFLRGISFLEKYNHSYDILIFPHQLGAAIELVRHFPNQKFVIDHLAKPYIKDGFFDGWAVLMREIAKSQNVYCKLSGMITEAGYNDWSTEQIYPYIELVLNAFGPERIMFGSDWPVCLVAGNYQQVKSLVTDYIARLSPDEQKAIMGLNAMGFYNL